MAPAADNMQRIRRPNLRNAASATNRGQTRLPAASEYAAPNAARIDSKRNRGALAASPCRVSLPYSSNATNDNVAKKGGSTKQTWNPHVRFSDCVGQNRQNAATPVPARHNVPFQPPSARMLQLSNIKCIS